MNAPLKPQDIDDERVLVGIFLQWLLCCGNGFTNGTKILSYEWGLKFSEMLTRDSGLKTYIIEEWDESKSYHTYKLSERALELIAAHKEMEYVHTH
jgi:hypothetical protein